MSKTIAIQYLYLDLDQCTRCQTTEGNLNEAILKLKADFSDYTFDVELIHIDSQEKAVKYKFESSPTIRINSDDIPIKLIETKCQPCGDLAGTDTDCRVWEYLGVQYDAAPPQMIIDYVSEYIASGKKFQREKKITPYKMPSNIKDFFDSKKRKGCCSPSKCGCS